MPASLRHRRGNMHDRQGPCQSMNGVLMVAYHFPPFAASSGIQRTLGFARHLSLKGRYPALLARPDRWISWWFGAVPKGLAMIRKYRPHVLWSTYPIATAHAIG